MSRTTLRMLSDGSSQFLRSLTPSRFRTPSPPQRSGTKAVSRQRVADRSKSPDRRGFAFSGVGPSDRGPHSKTTSAGNRPSSTKRRARRFSGIDSMLVSILFFAFGPMLAGKPTLMGNDMAAELAKSVKGRPKSLVQSGHDGCTKHVVHAPSLGW